LGPTVLLVNDAHLPGGLPPLGPHSAAGAGLPPLPPVVPAAPAQSAAAETITMPAPPAAHADATPPVTQPMRTPSSVREGRGRTAVIVLVAAVAGAVGGAVTTTFVGGDSVQSSVPAAGSGGQGVPTASASGAPVMPLQDAIASAKPSVVQVRTATGQGSGVVMQSRGLVITNNHVAGTKGESVTIVTADNREVPADVVYSDPQHDLDVLKPSGAVGPGVPLAAEPDAALRAGDTVFAIGSPFGLMNTVTVGVVSAVGRQGNSGQSMIQTDAPINPGNSGGGLFDLRGRLVGVPTSINSPVPGNVGIGFAVTSAQVQAALESVK